MLPAVQRVLMTAPHDASPPGAVFIVDCSPLVPSGTKASAIIDKEETAGTLGKQLGKPVGRLLEKLLVGFRAAQPVGVEAGASLALGLLKAPPAEHGLETPSIVS